MWNFNSGAVLREYQHREGRREVTAVAFLAQGRGREAAVAAGQAAEQEPWWVGSAGGGSSDTGGADGSESSPGGGGSDGEEGKGEDGEEEGLPSLVSNLVLAGCMCVHACMCQPAKCHLSELQLMRWTQLGECISGILLASLPAPQATPCCLSPSHCASHVPCAQVLATGWSRNVCIWEDGEGHQVSVRRRLRQHDADVLCMACLGDRVVATGGLGGRWAGEPLRAGLGSGLAEATQCGSTQALQVALRVV